MEETSNNPLIHGGSGSGSDGNSQDINEAIQEHAHAHANEQQASEPATEDTSCRHLSSLKLREGLEELMEHIQKHRHEEPSSSLEERYLLLISSYPPECLSHAVTIKDTDGTDTVSKMGRLPIHLACDKGAPVSIIKSLLEADAQNKKHDKNSDATNKNKNTNSNSNSNTSTNNTILQPDTWGDLPIHIACSRAAACMSRSDTERYGRLQMLRGRTDEDEDDNDNNNNSGVDNAVEIIRLLLEADTSNPKDSLSVKDLYESLPMHTAVRYNAPPAVIRLLLDAEGSSERSLSSLSLYTEGLHGQFPLTVACRSGNPSPEVLRLLLESDDDHCARTTITNSQHTSDADNTNSCPRQRPSTVLHKDATGRLPVHVFMLRNTCPTSLRILLNAMLGCRSTKSRHDNSHPTTPPRNSIMRLGLDVWKSQMLRDLIGAMDGSSGLYERDFTTRDKLDVICTELRVWYETCVALELVVWKIGCERVKNERRRTITRTPTGDGNEDTSNGTSEFRNNCRIVSGAEIIVPNVLSFLEQEPVENILDRFASYGYLGSGCKTNDVTKRAKP